MNINAAFPSNYLKAADYEVGQTFNVVIDRVELEELGQGRDKESKPVIYFRGKQKGLVLNKTNSKTIEKMFGAETDDWAGQSIVLCVVEVEFQGDLVMSFRIKPAPKAKAPEGVADTVRAKAKASQPDEPPYDRNEAIPADDIPF